MRQRVEPEHPELVSELRRHGWRRAPDGWRHKCLWFPWPFALAVRLTREAEVGSEPLHKLVRRETKA